MRGRKSGSGGLRKMAEAMVAEMKDALGTFFYIYDEVSALNANMKEFRERYIRAKAENIQLKKEAAGEEEPKRRGKRKMASVSRPELVALREKVKAYIEEHPGCTWTEVHEAIPSHYANAYSLATSMKFAKIGKDLRYSKPAEMPPLEDSDEEKDPEGEDGAKDLVGAATDGGGGR